MAIDESIKEQARLFFLKSKRNTLTICGKSMYPSLREGWHAEVSPAEERDIRVGDIVVFPAGQNLIVHRIIGRFIVTGTVLFLQKGDNEAIPGRIGDGRVIGRVTRVMTGDGSEVPRGTWRYGETKRFFLTFVTTVLWGLYSLEKAVMGNKHKDLARGLQVIYWAFFLTKR
jgi:hypothetical protein